MEAGRTAHERMLPLLSFMMQSIEMLIKCEKTLLERQSIIATSYCRQPCCHLDAWQLDELERHATGVAEWLSGDAACAS